MGTCVYRISVPYPRMFPNFETKRLGNARQKELQSGSKRSEPLASARRPPPPRGMRNATAAVKRMVLRASVRTVNPHCMSSAALLLVDQFGQYLESGECPTLVAVPACLCDFLRQATQRPRRTCYRCSEIAYWHCKVRYDDVSVRSWALFAELRESRWFLRNQ